MNDDLSLWDFAAPPEDFQNLGMNFHDMARGQYPAMEGGWAEYDRAGHHPGPIIFGFDDLVFK